MKTFKIEIRENLSKIIEVKALEIVNKMYKNEEVVLDSSNFINREIKVSTQIDNESIKKNLILDIIDYLYYDEKKHFEEFDNEKSLNHIFTKLEKLKSLL